MLLYVARIFLLHFMYVATFETVLEFIFQLKGIHLEPLLNYFPIGIFVQNFHHSCKIIIH